MTPCACRARAKDAAGVSARIPGTLDDVFVDEGAREERPLLA